MFADWYLGIYTWVRFRTADLARRCSPGLASACLHKFALPPCRHQRSWLPPFRGTGAGVLLLIHVARNPTRQSRPFSVVGLSVWNGLSSGTPYIPFCRSLL